MKPQSAFHLICAESALGVMAFNRIICDSTLSMLNVFSSNYHVATLSLNGHGWIWIVSILLTVYVIYSCIYFCGHSCRGLLCTCAIILLLCQKVIVQESMHKLNLLRSFQTTVLAWRESHGLHSFHHFLCVCVTS